MRKGTEFEVTKEEYERAKVGAKDKTRTSYYMSGEDIPKHFRLRGVEDERRR
jgi:hypothetical protein